MNIIQEAKTKLPLPDLMKVMGYGEYAKPSVCSPFREENNPSWGIFRKSNDDWNWKDQGTGEFGDEIDFIERVEKCSKNEAIQKYQKLVAGVDQTSISNDAAKHSNIQANSFIPLPENGIERIAKWRGYSQSFTAELSKSGLIGLHKGCIAFPVHRCGAVIGCHYRKEDGTWRYTQGANAQPLIIGDLVTTETIFILESQWDALAMADKMDFFGSGNNKVAFLITRGAANGKLISGHVGGKARLIAVPQNDPQKANGKVPSEEWLCAVQKVAGRNIYKLHVPREFKDANDWLRTGIDKAVLFEAIENATKLPEVSIQEELPQMAVETINGKPAIMLPCEGRLIGEFAEEIGSLLRNQAIFARQGCAFTLNPSGEKLELASSQWLRTWVERSVVCYKMSKQNQALLKLKQTMSEDIARAVLVSPQFLDQLRKVEFFNPCRLPIMRINGDIELLPRGYDVESLTYTHEEAPEILPMTTQEAQAIIGEVLEEFAFSDDNGRSKAVSIASMLTVFASRLLPKGALRPCFVFVGNAEGCGKTLLARLACVPYTTADVRGAPTTEEEFEKVLLSAVMGGRKVLLLDNLKGHLDSAKLEGFLTSSRYTGRILGVSKEFSGDVDTTVLLTGNRLTISPDLRRRTLFVELFMKELKAENRKYKRILDDAAINMMRPQILSALWQLIKEWDKAGRPKAAQINSSFPRWCETIGGIVEHASYGCPTIPAEIEGVGDTDTLDIMQLAEAMKIQREYDFSEIVRLSGERGFFERFTSDTDMNDDLSRRAKSRFSKLLVSYNRRFVTPEKRFVVEGQGHKRKFRILSN